MSDTKTPTPPLVSDDAIAKVMADQFKTTRDHVVACGAARSVRNIYEATRKEDAAKIARLEGLVQEAVNALYGLCHGPMSMEDAADAALAALALAKSQLNISPTKP